MSIRVAFWKDGKGVIGKEDMFAIDARASFRNGRTVRSMLSLVWAVRFVG